MKINKKNLKISIKLIKAENTAYSLGASVIAAYYR